MAFVIMTWALYMQALEKKRDLLSSLTQKIERLSLEKTSGEAEKMRLVSRIESQEDPQWIRLVLKEKLGVVREGEIKVVFQERDE